jgi:hypothetical protein
MKYKNYKSAIHNFTDSFISIDYMKSGRLAVNVLIDLYNLGKENEATFNFIKNTIQPNDAETKECRQLINDYLDWLPEHFESHNCDLSKLEKLEITISTDFNKAITPPRMNNQLEFTVNALTKWKATGKAEQTVEIVHTEMIKQNFLKLRIPEMK